MSNHEWSVNQSRVVQYQQDRMQEAAAERSLKAMRREQQEGKASEREKQLQPVATMPRPFSARRAWQAFTTYLASFL